MSISINHDQRLKVSEVIKAQEAKTSGEIYCVIARKSDDYSSVITVFAVLAALFIPAIIAILNFDLAEELSKYFLGWTHNSEQVGFAENLWLILTLQVIVVIIGAVVSKVPAFVSFLIPKFVKRQTVHKAAIDQFKSHGIAQTEGSTGVLIYVSLSEQMVEILADKGIYSKVDKSVWREAISKILLKSKSDDLVGGLVDGIEEVGAILRTHFPPSDVNKNEISDSVVFI
jgi:putative membrane protein